MLELRDEHMPALAQLASVVWKLNPDTGYWRWKYRINSGKCNGYVYFSKGELVGAAGYWHRSFLLNGKEIPGVMLVDMMTHPEYRGRAFGKIAEETKKLPQNAFFYGFPNPLSRKFYVQSLKRQNIKRFDVPVQKYSSVYRLPDHTGFAKKVLAGSFGAFQTFIQKLKCTAVIKGAAISKATTITGEFDRLWERLSPEYQFIAVRDAAYLKWRFTDAPHKYTIWTLRTGASLSGYMVTTTITEGKAERGIILDWLVSRDNPEDFEILFAQSIIHLLKTGVDRIDTWLFSHQTDWIKTAKSNLFFGKESGRTFLCFAADQITGGVPINDSMLFATMGDSDTPGPGREENNA